MSESATLGDCHPVQRRFDNYIKIIPAQRGNRHHLLLNTHGRYSQLHPSLESDDDSGLTNWYASPAEITCGFDSHPPYSILGGIVKWRVPHITLGYITNNTEIEVSWEEFQEQLEPLREKLNNTLTVSWEAWEIPRDKEEDWPQETKELHSKWWELLIARQKEIDASIESKADYEYLYDKPFEDNKMVRVAGLFTVESLSPHRILGQD